MFYESEEFYRNLIAQVKDYAIFTTDPRGVITTWNEGCKNVLGYDRDEFIGQHIKMVFTPEAVDVRMVAPKATGHGGFRLCR